MVNAKELSLQRRFLLGIVTCAVLPLVIVSLVSYRGLMTSDVTLRKHLSNAQILVESAPEERLHILSDEFARMEKEMVAVSLQTKKLIIISSVLSFIVIVAVGVFLSRSLAENKKASGMEKADRPVTMDLEDHLEEMRKKLGNLINDDD